MAVKLNPADAELMATSPRLRRGKDPAPAKPPAPKVIRGVDADSFGVAPGVSDATGYDEPWANTKDAFRGQQTARNRPTQTPQAAPPQIGTRFVPPPAKTAPAVTGTVAPRIADREAMPQARPVMGDVKMAESRTPASASGASGVTEQDRSDLAELGRQRNMLRGHLDRVQSGLAGRMNPADAEAARLQIVSQINAIESQMRPLSAKVNQRPQAPLSAEKTAANRASLQAQLAHQMATQPAAPAAAPQKTAADFTREKQYRDLGITDPARMAEMDYLSGRGERPTTATETAAAGVGQDHSDKQNNFAAWEAKLSPADREAFQLLSDSQKSAVLQKAFAGGASKPEPDTEATTLAGLKNRGVLNAPTEEETAASQGRYKKSQGRYAEQSAMADRDSANRRRAETQSADIADAEVEAMIREQNKRGVVTPAEKLQEKQVELATAQIDQAKRQIGSGYGQAADAEVQARRDSAALRSGWNEAIVADAMSAIPRISSTFGGWWHKGKIGPDQSAILTRGSTQARDANTLADSIGEAVQKVQSLATAGDPARASNAAKMLLDTMRSQMPPDPSAGGYTTDRTEPEWVQLTAKLNSMYRTLLNLVSGSQTGA